MNKNNSDKKLQDITLALAGIFQSAALVRDLAKSGVTEEAAFITSISSIYKIDAANTADVYGGVSHLRLGFTEILKLLGNEKSPHDPYLSRYVISIIQLERKLRNKPEIYGTLTRRIKYAVSQASYFSETHPTVINSLADIYLKTLGTLSYRIQVLGQAKFLHQDEVINKVRTLLLAGVRSAVLWRQMGGRRWQLFLWRGKIAKMAKEFLAQC